MKYYKPIFKYVGDKKTLKFDHYKVCEKSKTHTDIYCSGGVIITSRPTFKSACKVAKLLNQAFIDGYNLRDDNHYDW